MDSLNEGTFDMLWSPTPLGGSQLPKKETFQRLDCVLSRVHYLKIPLLQDLLPPPHQKGGAHVEMEMGEALRFSLTSERRTST